MMHSFDIDVAKKYGMLEAILFNYFVFWISKNEANGAHFHDGRTWTYNSIRAFCELFPYASKGRIDRALTHLEKDGIIVTGNYNQSAYDRTKWYALTDFGSSICSKREMETSETGNQFAGNEKPIPVNNTISNTITYTGEIAEIVAYLNETAGKKYRANSSATAKHIRARLNEGFTVEDCKTVIRTKTAEWKGGEMDRFLRPQTLFGSKFEAYLNQAPPKQAPQQKPQMSQDEIDRSMEMFAELRRQEREAARNGEAEDHN